MEPQAIIMCGISGSGKTYYARKFEKSGYIRLSTDALIWDKTGSDLNSLAKEEQRKLFAQCNQEVRKRLVDLLKSGKKVVVDATHCKRSVRDEIRKLCKEEGVNPLFLYCNADKNELWRRLSRRKGTGPDDLIVTQEDFFKYWQGFEHPQEDESDVEFFTD